MAYIDWERPRISRGKKMQPNEITLSCHVNKYYNLTLNQELSSLIKEKGYSYINIKQDDITGEIGIEINHEKGLKLSKTGSGKSFNYKLSNKDWVYRLHKVLKLELGSCNKLKITDNLSRIDKCMFFRIINQ